MPFLLSKNNTYNVLVDKTGESIFFKNYPVRFTQKPVVVAKSLRDEYTAQIDELGNLQIIYKSSNNSIVHLYENSNKFDKKVILDDFNNSYKIGNLKYICSLRHYLFYTAINPYEQTSDLIFHSFTHNDDSEPQSLFTLPSLDSPYECYMYNNTIYLLCCIVNNNQHELNLYKYNINDAKWSEYETICTQSNPIIDFSLCINNRTLHVVYAEEQYGHFKIKYVSKHKDWNNPVEVHSTGQMVAPIIFTYNNIIWINWKENNVLMASLSSDNGHTFVKPIKCSAQSQESKYYYFYGFNNKSLTGNKFYGYVDRNPVLAVLSQVDTDNVLLYSENNTEMKSIILETMSSDTVNTEQVEKELTEQKEIRESITNQYNDLVKLAQELQEEGKKWRAKFAKADQENKKLKKKIRRISIEAEAKKQSTQTNIDNNKEEVEKTTEKPCVEKPIQQSSDDCSKESTGESNEELE